MTHLIPVIKWAGGKRQLLQQLIACMPPSYNKYYEPFFGGGALFCELLPETAVINDFNKQLINMYKQIKFRPGKLCERLDCLQEKYNTCEDSKSRDALYYAYRADFNEKMSLNDKASCLDSAALLIFLNRTGFNGLYRVNKEGTYNVPSAHKKSVQTYDRDNIMAMSRQLKKARILTGDFEKACKTAEKGDFVFFDSPYYDTFDTYQSGGFSDNDHRRLFNLFKSLSDKGVYCMLTNSDCDFIKNLYSEFHIKSVDVKRMINCDSTNRVGKEVIITNYFFKTP